MALRRALAKRFYDGYRAASQAVTLDSTISVPSLHALTYPPVPASTIFHREYLTSPGSAGERRAQALRRLPPDFVPLPVTDRLGDVGVFPWGDRLPAAAAAADPACGLSVAEVRKMLRIYRLEKVKAKLRAIPASSISYGELVGICVNDCGDEGRGMELAKMLDESGSVIVFGNIVLLSPEQVMKSMQSVISRALPNPNDPRRQELHQMEAQKDQIDSEARAQVRAELYFGLGLMTIQTLGFMRLTFWELSWDVMEPICFFVTSLHFAAAYAFFLRTSREPSFQGYFRHRFESKQRKLFEARNFDVQRYDELRALFGPDNLGKFP